MSETETETSNVNKVAACVHEETIFIVVIKSKDKRNMPNKGRVFNFADERLACEFKKKNENSGDHSIVVSAVEKVNLSFKL